MAFTLAFSVAEQGDAKIITITDTTGTGTDGWDGSPAVSSIASGSNQLLLNVIVTGSDGTVTAYDEINLYDEFGPFATTADLVFALDCTLLKVSSVAIGTANDELPDGLYEFSYEWTGAGPTSTTATVLIDGIVKSGVYALLRTIPTRYECEDYHERDLLDIIFIKGYYDSMIATAIVGREDEVINQLLVLERLVTNGSYNNW